MRIFQICRIGISLNSLVADYIKSEYNELAFEILSYDLTNEEMKDFFTEQYNKSEKRRIKNAMKNYYPNIVNVSSF